MFTGIVEELGSIRSVHRGQHSSVLSIAAKDFLSDLKVGDSVAAVSYTHLTLPTN